MSFQTRLIGDLVDAGEANIQTGPFGTQLRASDYVSSGVPVINVRNIGFGDLRQEQLEYVAEHTAERLSAHSLQTNDIVFGRKGAVERHLLVKPEQEKWMQGSDCIRLRITSTEVNPRFVSYSLLREAHKQWMLTQAGNKATMASLNHDIIRRIPLRLPTPEIQARVAATLSAYDDVIGNNERRMKLLEEAARLLYQEWFVRLKFPGHEHTPIVDGVPQGWERASLDQALLLQRGFDLPIQQRMSGTVPIYGSTGICGTHNQSKAVGPGVVTERSGTLGEVHYAIGDYWPLNTALWVKEFKRVTPLFALFLLRSLNLAQHNGGVSVPTLDRNVVHSLEVSIPERRWVTSFEEFAVPIFRQINNLELQNQKLRAARDLLVPRLMSGEIAV